MHDIYQQTDKGLNSVEKTYRYDQADRVLRIRNVVKKENTIMLDVWTSATTYTGTGLVKNKYLHSTEGTHYRERLEHQYNPRSWLRKVEGKTSTATNFGVELRYVYHRRRFPRPSLYQSCVPSFP